MNLAVPREVHPGEVRVALIPEHVAKLVNSGAKVVIESGLESGDVVALQDPTRVQVEPDSPAPAAGPGGPTGRG